jgi:hypothetical protein
VNFGGRRIEPRSVYKGKEKTSLRLVFAVHYDFGDNQQRRQRSVKKEGNYEQEDETMDDD